jgi:hypothetical protein
MGASPDQLRVALKEWAIVCRALEEGRQVLLLRKGGIYESAGEFEVEHRRFLLFPTYLHQKREHLKPEEHPRLEVRQAEPAQVRLGSAAEVTDIVQLRNRTQMDGIAGRHIWTPALVDMRFNYRPENPLYLLLVRVYRLAEAVSIENTPAYAGCKSWVPLEKPVDVCSARPVLDDEAYERARKAILSGVKA